MAGLGKKKSSKKWTTFKIWFNTNLGKRFSKMKCLAWRNINMHLCCLVKIWLPKDCAQITNTSISYMLYVDLRWNPINCFSSMHFNRLKWLTRKRKWILCCFNYRSILRPTRLKNCLFQSKNNSKDWGHLKKMAKWPQSLENECEFRGIRTYYDSATCKYCRCVVLILAYI